MSANNTFSKENLDYYLRELAKESILEIGQKYPDLLNADNINDIIEQARKKKTQL
jgi:hypothetical protein